MGDDTLPPIEAQSSIMLDTNDVAGSSNENGLLYLLKVGPDGKTPLSKVKFRLFNPDGTPAQAIDGKLLEEKETGTDGKTNFIIQVPGTMYSNKRISISKPTCLRLRNTGYVSLMRRASLSL